MSMKNIVLCFGLFSIIMGWVNYDPEIETAAVPVVTGIIVVILALFGLIPEFVACQRCGKKSIGTKGVCRSCQDVVKKCIKGAGGFYKMALQEVA